MKAFRLPDLGEGLQEAEIREWHVGEGDQVRSDDPLVSVETEKAVVEVPAPWTGRIGKLCARTGETVKVGAVIVEFEDTSATATAGREQHLSTNRPLIEFPPLRPFAGSDRIVAMPAVRLLARELAVDLTTVKGSGPEGAILVRDLAAAFRARSGVEPEQIGPAVTESDVTADYRPLAGTRRAMARTMARSHAEVVPATVHEEATFAPSRVRTNLTVRLLRALIAAIETEPVLNAWFEMHHGLKMNRRIDVGIAVDTADGLIVPVLKDVQGRDSANLRAELDRLVAAAHARTLRVDELRGATITLSNYGMIGGLHATPVVVPPQVAILGAGRLTPRVLAQEERPVVRPVLPLSLSYDHRAITGGEAARFILAVVADLERPE
ncbi:MAG TPA: dihydrolipoamide acetyltransferase family protein [Alphaproteobacteria bacterium]|nr:dihydrolipoamide acetyltransferase family protein [Alphaproteobacteria bacterium]